MTIYTPAKVVKGAGESRCSGTVPHGIVPAWEVYADLASGLMCHTQAGLPVGLLRVW